MKKFLFTLAALFMAGSALADSYLYIDDMTITQAEVEAGQRIEVKVKAHFDARVSGFDVQIAIPEAWTLFNNGQCRKGADMTISYLDSFGDPATVSAGLSGNAYHAIGIFTDPGYEDYAMESYGVAKWEAGDYENFYSFYIMPDEALATGELTVSTIVTSGNDTRGGTVKDNGDAGQTFVKTATITVEGATPPEPEKTPNPVITVTPDEDEMGATVAATGMGEVLLYADGVLVENPYHVARVEGQDVTIVFTATAQGENMLISDVEEYELTLDALPVTPPTPGDLTGEIVIGDPDKNGNVTIDYTGNEDVTIVVTVNGEEVEVVDGVITVGEGESEIVVTVTADNYNTLTTTKVVNYTAPVDPEDPHMQGYWLVVIDMFGNHNWFPLTKGANNDYVTTVSLEYYTYGLYDPDPENAAQVPFYFVVDGVQYGAEEPMTVAAIGQAMENPLSESEEYYTVPVGYSYALGIAIIENEYYAYVSQAYPTSVDELNAGKTVAGVRYFNMAGQEMQEANGMTIVVTTYTDGTTSAVKVMK